MSRLGVGAFCRGQGEAFRLHLELEILCTGDTQLIAPVVQLIVDTTVAPVQLPKPRDMLIEANQFTMQIRRLPMAQYQ
ncbi:hypothetical protein D3C81_1392560 [compost metagenome]